MLNEQYLMIRNPGRVNPLAMTLLGVSTTRYAGRTGTIGTFGSGSKYAIALLLRLALRPILICGNLKMEFFTKVRYVDGNEFHQVCVKYSGKNDDGTTNNRTEDLGFTLEWGIHDWTRLDMAIREFVANAIDGAMLNDRSFQDIEIQVVEKPRAKADHTTIFIPYTPEVEEVWRKLGEMFLHFKHYRLIDKKILPKVQEDGKTRIYKNGVLVCTLDKKSIFDYNVGNELQLDESRNANPSEARSACASALSNASASDLCKAINVMIDNPQVDVWENEFSHYDLGSYSPTEEQIAAWSVAWEGSAGLHSVVTDKSQLVGEFVRRKGFKAVAMPSQWKRALEKYGIKSEVQVLSGLEKEGFDATVPTKDMQDAVDKVWNMLECFELTNGKEKPKVMAFSSIMNAEAQTMGKYQDNTVYLHTDLAESFMLTQTALEEVVHHVTGSGDMSRDLQDFLFRVITKIALT